MRGLLGDATEDMVEKLDDGKDKNVDEEQEFKMAAVLSRCEGLDAVMWRLGCVRDFIQGHQLISAALKLLDCCIKLEVCGEKISLSLSYHVLFPFLFPLCVCVCSFSVLSVYVTNLR